MHPRDSPRSRLARLRSEKRRLLLFVLLLGVGLAALSHAASFHARRGGGGACADIAAKNAQLTPALLEVCCAICKGLCLVGRKFLNR